MKKKVVLFDMDGVITDTDHLHYDVWKELMEEYGVHLSEELYIKHLQSKSHKEALISLLGDISFEEIQKISDNKNQRSKARLQEGTQVYPDAMKLIEYLDERGWVLAVVSASSNALFVIKEIKMEKYFALIVSGTKDTKLKNKPHPDIYLYAMKELGVSPEETLIIEDSISGITAGLKSGASVIGVNRGNLRIDRQEGLTVVNDLLEVMNILNKEKNNESED